MKEKLLDLKAAGLSLNKIAAELGIAKTTALRWAGELHDKIMTRECLVVEEIRERHGLKRVAMIEDIAAQRAKVREAIKAHDLGKESLKEKLNLDKYLAEEFEKLTKDHVADSGYYERDIERDGIHALPKEVSINLD